MHKTVVVNSTPPISLGNIEALWILEKLYGEVIVPEAVYEEVLKKSDKASSLISSAQWITVKKISGNYDRKMYQAKLHAGEVEVMILAQEIDADVVIIDDNAAKKAAQYLGINVAGTMGILLKAKEEGVVSGVKQYIERLLDNDFYVSDAVIGFVLELAGEQ